jgi:hypothetical protein
MLFIRDKYGVMSPPSLSKDSKIETAVWMHHNYNASNKQIGRILHLDLQIVDALFPPKK